MEKPDVEESAPGSRLSDHSPAASVKRGASKRNATMSALDATPTTENQDDVPPVRGALQTSIVLDDLAKAIRIELGAVVSAFGSAVDHGMNVGDLLVAAQGRIGWGRWTAWLRDHCSLSARSARDYMALARGRQAIEAKIGMTHAELSLQGALRLIGRSPGGQRKPRPVPALTSASWRAATPGERSTFVRAVGVDELLADIPEQSREDAKPLSKAHLAAVCGSLKLALGTTNDHEAVAALRTVNRLLAAAGRDYHNLIAALERRHR
jgi:hypothetical protein